MATNVEDRRADESEAKLAPISDPNPLKITPFFLANANANEKEPICTSTIFQRQFTTVSFERLMKHFSASRRLARKLPYDVPSHGPRAYGSGSTFIHRKILI